jgi:hypothetical protein
MVKRRIIQTINRHTNLMWLLIALFVYTATTLAMMYPVPFQLDSVIAGEERGDAYQYVWSLWWAKQAVLEPAKGLAHLTLMNHPVGIEHPFMLTLVGVNLSALPFSLLLPPAAAYNSQVLLSFILSGMAMYWLATDMTGDHKAGLVGGFVFAFFLNKTGHVIGGHLPQATVYWIPLYVLLLRRTIRKPSWRTALATALVLIFACLIHVMHLVYLVLPVTVTVLLAGMLELKDDFITWQRLGSLVILFGPAALIVAPFLLPMALLAVEDASYLYITGTVDSSTDLLAFFTPSRYNPFLDVLDLMPSWIEQVFSSQKSLFEGLAYPGVLAAGLAMWGLIRRRRSTWIWGALALIAAVLSLGPLLKVGGELVLYEMDMERSHILLPYALLKQVPLLDVGRTPGRLNEATMFAMAILASYGMAELSALLARRPRLAVSLLALVLLGTGSEYVAVWPFPVSPAAIPPTIQRIANESGGGALLHLGMTRRDVDHNALYYQTVTQRPCVGGWVHRTLPTTPPWWETLSKLAQPDQAAGDVIPRPDLTSRVAWLRHFDVDYVILDRTVREWKNPVSRDFVEALLGPPRYTDPSLVAFPVTDEILAPENTRLYTFDPEGWHPPEWDGDMWRRWLYEDGYMYLYSTQPEVGSLRFTVDSHIEFPELEVYLGEQLLDSFVVGERITYTTRLFSLAQGMNVLRFSAPGGCRQTIDDPRCWGEALLSPPGDKSSLPCKPEEVRTDCRSFVFDRIVFVPQDELLPGEALDVNFGDRMRLRDWRLDGGVPRPGTALTVTLAWEAREVLDGQYVVFVHLLSSDNALAAQHDAPPVGQMIPPSLWPSGAVFGYPVVIELPDELPAGDYRLLVGVYLWPSLERMPVLTDVQGAEMRVAELTDVQIVP